MRGCSRCIAPRSTSLVSVALRLANSGSCRGASPARRVVSGLRWPCAPSTRPRRRARAAPNEPRASPRRARRRRGRPARAVEVEYSAIRVGWGSRRTEAPMRHVDLEGGELGQPHERHLIVHQGVGVDVILALNLTHLDPIWRGITEILLKEERASAVFTHAIWPPLSRRRAPLAVRQHRCRNRTVVGDHVALRRAGAQIQHLLHVRNTNASAVNRHHLFLLCHAYTIMCGMASGRFLTVDLVLL